jgi:hypothetical protein
MNDSTTYFATALSYACKVFMKSTTVLIPLKNFGTLW